MDITNVSEEEWLDYAHLCPSATFYHSPIWHRIWWDYFGLRSAARFVRFPSGRTALLPISASADSRSSKACRDHSSPEGTYGGPITTDSLAADEVSALRRMCLERPRLIVRQNPFSASFNRFLDWQTLDFTQVVDLSVGWDDIYSRWKRNHRGSLRKGLRSGVEAAIAETSAEWRSYFEIYLETVRRWDCPLGIYEARLFEILRSLDRRYCKLWLAYHRGRMIAGKIVFTFNRHRVTWLSASRTEDHGLKPNNVLHACLINDSLARRLRYYDLDTSAGLNGVVSFKEGLGTTRLEANLHFGSDLTTRLSDGSELPATTTSKPL